MAKSTRKPTGTKRKKGEKINEQTETTENTEQTEDTEQTENSEQLESTEPTEEEIRRRAHEIYLERGGTEGYELDDWFQAERELREQKRNKDTYSESDNT